MKRRSLTVTKIEQTILMIRGQRVMLDTDLADIYGVPTKRLNEQVYRNIERFPDDFMFRLTKSEKDEVVANCDRLQKMKFSTSLPNAFTEQGVAMLSSVLKSKRAVAVNIEIMRVFVKLRQLLLTHTDLARKLDALEKRYDAQFKIVFDAIRELMTPVEKPKRRIGF